VADELPPETDPYEIPPAFEPDASEIPVWADDRDRFRICYALTLLIAQRYDPIFCKQLYDDPRMLTGDDDKWHPPLAEPRRQVVHPGEPPTP
jgi:hypothetical protein